MRYWRTEYKVLAILLVIFAAIITFFLIKGNYVQKVEDEIKKRRLVNCTEAKFTKGIEYTHHTCTIQDEMGNSYTIEYPQIVEKNKDIKNLNKQLKKKFDEVYNSLQYHHANQKLQLESYQKVNYEVHYGKGIVSFLVENQSMIGNIKEKVEEYTIYNIDASTYEVLDTEEVKEKIGINRDYASSVKGMVVKMYLDKFRYDYNNELGVYRNSLIDESVENITYHAINRIYIDSDECIHFILYIFNPDRAETIPYNFYLDKNGKTTYEIME